MRAVYLILSLIVMFIAMLQKDRKKQLPKDYHLNGYFTITPPARFSLSRFFEGIYQDSITNFLQDNVGYNGYLIALKDQVDWSVFHQTNFDVCAGQDNTLFLNGQTKTHCGRQQMPPNELADKIAQCVALKALLDSAGIASVYVMAPGKSGFFEDKVPAQYLVNCSDDNDYKHILQKYHESNIRVIDMNQWFHTMRATSPYPLFPRLGLHWSYYGAYLAEDSIAKYIANTLHIRMPKNKISHIKITNKARSPDDDAVNLLNILFPMESDSLAYPELSYDDQPIKPKILIVSDSFTWLFIASEQVQHHYRDDSYFWYYKSELYTIGGGLVTKDINHVNVYELLKGTEMVVFMASEFSYNRMDFEFYHALMAQPTSIDSLLNPKYHGI